MAGGAHRWVGVPEGLPHSLGSAVAPHGAAGHVGDGNSPVCGFPFAFAVGENLHWGTASGVLPLMEKGGLQYSSCLMLVVPKAVNDSKPSNLSVPLSHPLSMCGQDEHLSPRPPSAAMRFGIRGNFVLRP